MQFAALDIRIYAEVKFCVVILGCKSFDFDIAEIKFPEEPFKIGFFQYPKSETNRRRLESGVGDRGIPQDAYYFNFTIYLGFKATSKGADISDQSMTTIITFSKFVSQILKSKSNIWVVSNATAMPWVSIPNNTVGNYSSDPAYNVWKETELILPTTDQNRYQGMKDFIFDKPTYCCGLFVGLLDLLIPFHVDSSEVELIFFERNTGEYISYSFDTNRAIKTKIEYDDCDETGWFLDGQNGFHEAFKIKRSYFGSNKAECVHKLKPFRFVGQKK
eukprot:222909_1